MRKLRSVEAEALVMRHTNFRSACSVKVHSPDSPRWHQHQIQCNVTTETPKPSFRSKKLIFRELGRPFETAPKTTRESTSNKSRLARTPSRVTRLRRLIRLSSSKRLVCLPFEEAV